jgi:regulator of sigma E protease
MLTVLAFIVALGVLIAVHEYGHYRMAVACGVKVLRFSVGFGKTIFRWQPANQKHGQSTEFVLSAFPFGGYVKMLDEREAPVAPEERQHAFNTQPLRSRAAIVAAGPLANLLLAVLLYATVNWTGVEEALAIVASPVAGSVAEAAGLRGGEQIAAAAFDGEELVVVRSFEDLRWKLTQAALEGRNLRLQVQMPTAAPSTGLDAVPSETGPAESGAATPAVGRAERARPRELVLDLAGLQTREADASLFRKIGIASPWTKPVLGEVVAGGAADKAGLRAGDLVLAVGAVPVVDGQQLRELIRSSAKSGRVEPQVWRVVRGASELKLSVEPQIRTDNGVTVGRIGAYVGLPPAMIMVRHGLLDGLVKGAVRTWEVSVLTLRMMGKMLIGEASLKNLSGPLTIADYAGKSASLGITSYLVFLALISVSLGVLNLLPLPVLDGGHLMYYLWEGLTGKGVSEVWMERFQRSGVAVLLVMMSIAMFNDVTRLFG